MEVETLQRLNYHASKCDRQQARRGLEAVAEMDTARTEMETRLDQADLAREVLAELSDLPSAPVAGSYLSRLEADEIVRTTIANLESGSDSVERIYLTGHQKRLAEALTMIPRASSADASCLDVGCFGYFGYWLVRHLGYSRVVGIEMNTSLPEAKYARTLTVGQDSVEIEIFNFDISVPGWPDIGTFDCVLFFETLEHINEDPSGVLERLSACLQMGGSLVISVPNGVSHKTLAEFLTGMPPWTYWFFHPDLRHEPRHSFEYTPFVKLFALHAAGFRPNAFRTIVAYDRAENVAPFFRVGQALGTAPELFGETMITQATKVADTPLFRFPDCLYDGDAYYRSIYPVLAARRGASLAKALGLLDSAARAATLIATNGELDQAIELSRVREVAALARVEAAEVRSTEAHIRMVEAEKREIAARDREIECSRRETALAARLRETEDALATAMEKVAAAEQRAANQKQEFLVASNAAADLRAKTRELAYLLTVYQERDIARDQATPAPRTPARLDTRPDARLLLVSLAAPRAARILAKRGRRAIETPWQQHFLKYPWKVSEWRALRRLQRRLQSDPKTKKQLLDQLR